MTLSDLAALGSFVSGVAVVVTLAFLAVQLRQANRYQRAAMQLGRAARAESSFARQTNPEIARIVAKALTSDEPLSETESRIWLYTVAGDFRGFEDTFLQHRAGLLEHAGMESDDRTIRAFLVSPAYRAAWQLVAITFNADFRRYVDTLLGQVAPFPTGETSKVYQATVAAERAKVKQQTPNPLDHSSALASLEVAMGPADPGEKP